MSTILYIIILNGYNYMMDIHVDSGDIASLNRALQTLGRDDVIVHAYKYTYDCAPKNIVNHFRRIAARLILDPNDYPIIAYSVDFKFYEEIRATSFERIEGSTFIQCDVACVNGVYGVIEF